jgi:hypothetical protein
MPLPRHTTVTDPRPQTPIVLVKIQLRPDTPLPPIPALKINIVLVQKAETETEAWDNSSIIEDIISI